MTKTTSTDVAPYRDWRSTGTDLHIGGESTCWLLAAAGVVTLAGAAYATVIEPSAGSDGRTQELRESGQTWVTGAFARLYQLAIIQEGLLGPGRRGPNTLAIQNAGLALKALVAWQLCPDLIAPSPEEGVSLEFVDGGRTACIEFLNTGEILAVIDDARVDAPEVWAVEASRLNTAIGRLAQALGA